MATVRFNRGVRMGPKGYGASSRLSVPVALLASPLGPLHQGEVIAVDGGMHRFPLLSNDLRRRFSPFLAWAYSAK